MKIRLTYFVIVISIVLNIIAGVVIYSTSNDFSKSVKLVEYQKCLEMIENSRTLAVELSAKESQDVMENLKNAFGTTTNGSLISSAIESCKKYLS